MSGRRDPNAWIDRRPCAADTGSALETRSYPFANQDDEPILVQYRIFVEKLLSGDFGVSYVTREPVLDLILDRLPATIELVLLAMLIAVCIGLPLGLVAGIKHGGLVSKAVDRLSILAYSTPTFWFGLLLIYGFSVYLGIFPAGGRGDTVEVFGARWSFLTLDGLSHLVLPALTLALYEIGYIARLTSTLVQETLPTDFIRFCRAKGLPERLVIRRHLLRNIVVPLATVIGLETGVLLAGSVITETVFGWPGVGKLLVESVAALDRPMIVAFVVLAALVFIVLNSVVDILQVLIDPRLRRRRG